MADVSFDPETGAEVLPPLDFQDHDYPCPADPKMDDEIKRLREQIADPDFPESLADPVTRGSYAMHLLLMDAFYAGECLDDADCPDDNGAAERFRTR